MEINGTSGDDVLTGTSQADAIYGLNGNDAIDGSFGIDSLYGGDGNDTLYTLHTNVMGFQPDAAAVAHFVGLLQGGMTQGQLLELAATVDVRLTSTCWGCRQPGWNSYDLLAWILAGEQPLS